MKTSHPYRFKNRAFVIMLSAMCIMVLGSCSSMRGPAYKLSKQDDEVFTKPLRDAKKSTTVEDVLVEGGTLEQPPAGLQVASAPTLSPLQRADVANQSVMPTLDANKTVGRLSFNNMTVPTFINEVFGNQLGLSFVIEPRVLEARDLVTMRLASALNQQQLYQVATQTLAPYGVITSLDNNLLRFSYSSEASKGDTPLLVSGRALPDVPASNRPLFYVYTLKALSTPAVKSYITQLFKPNELRVNEDIFSNSLIFIGQRNQIEQAVAATQAFDKPAMSGMYSRIITPSISSVKELADNLENVLKTEGFAVRQGDGIGAAIKLMPLESVGKLVVFAKSDETLSHILNWASSLEVEKQSEIQQGLFSYQVQSTLASHIVGILNNLGVANVSGVQQSSTSDSQNNRSQTGLQQNNSNNGGSANNLFNSSQNNPNAKGRYTVDGQLNTILFSGSGKDWLQVLPVIKKLDKPAPSVMVEVILVELQLNDAEESGVEWTAKASVDDYDVTFGTLGTLGLKGSGLNFLGLDSAGLTRAAINLFYKNDKANIRSRPRLMVKSGGQASIDVGNEIPVITSTSQSNQSADAPSVQNFSYRRTGVKLDIKPTVHASGFVDIEIQQELSEAAEGSVSGNPIILNRSLSTTVTLRDGGSVLIGGLISSTTSEGEQGVPILGRLPVIGKLFRTDTNTQDRTELMVMIIPYVLNSPGEAEGLTDELQNERMQSLSIFN